MTPIRYTLLILYCLASIAHAGTCTVTWDIDSPATSYEVFRGAEKIATVTTNEATLTLPDNETSSLHVIAVSGAIRSEPSNILHVLPYRPQFSLDLAEWESASMQYATIPSPIIPPRAFVRAAFLSP